MERRLRATPRPAMTPLALLVLAACALAAPLHAASIPDTADLQKKIPAALPDDIKDPLPADHEIIAPEPAKETGNELRAKPEDIPVEVVVEDAEPSVKINEVDGEEIRRPSVDLLNPGPPQRQEHETQNPELHEDEQLKVSTIKENIEQTQILLRQSFQDVSDNIQNWFYKNDDQNKIQKNIQNLRETFTSQIQKLNDTIQTLIKPDASELVEQAEGSQRNYEQIQSGLKTLKDNFNNNVETLSAGVELVTSLRSSANAGDAVKEEAPATTTTPGSSTSPAASVPPQNIIAQMVNTFREQMIGGLTAMQNLISPTTQSPPPAGAQADAPVGSTPASGIASYLPPWLSNLPSNPFQLPNLPNLSTPLKPLNDWWQNISGSTTQKPAALGSSPAADKPAGSKPEADVSDKPADAMASPPAPAPAPAAAAEPTQPGGPIRQFLNNLQNSITNRDTPRVPVEKIDGQSKGGWYGPPRKPVGSGDNNDSGVSGQKSEVVKEPIKEESIKKETIKEESIKEESIKEEPIKEEFIKEESIKEESKKEAAEVKPESVPEKTDKS